MLDVGCGNNQVAFTAAALNIYPEGTFGFDMSFQALAAQVALRDIAQEEIKRNVSLLGHKVPIAFGANLLQCTNFYPAEDIYSFPADSLMFHVTIFLAALNKATKTVRAILPHPDVLAECAVLTTKDIVTVNGKIRLDGINGDVNQITCEQAGGKRSYKGFSIPMTHSRRLNILAAMMSETFQDKHPKTSLWLEKWKRVEDNSEDNSIMYQKKIREASDWSIEEKQEEIKNFVSKKDGSSGAFAYQMEQVDTWLKTTRKSQGEQQQTRLQHPKYQPTFQRYVPGEQDTPSTNCEKTKASSTKRSSQKGTSHDEVQLLREKLVELEAELQYERVKNKRCKCNLK
jgi:SAM-dependent methyltransferase